MDLISKFFILFFACVLIGYYLVPRKTQWLFLLAASLGFYAHAGLSFFPFLCFSILTSYLAGLALESSTDSKVRKWVLALAVACNAGILILFKIAHGIPAVSEILEKKNSFLVILFPLGISYYTLQVIAYLVDVYRRTVPAERNLFRYALFVSFFLQIVQGPIPRYSDLSKELYREHSFEYCNLAHGGQLILWGLIKKMVLADRLGVVVSTIFENPFAGSEVALALAFFTFQLYADFSGCVDLVRGCAEMMGIRMAENFQHPFFARSIREFWRCWHISLSTWLRDYIYIPLGGSRKGRIRTWINVLLTFCISGLWHGFTANYLLWGMLHGLYQIAGDVLRPIREKAVRISRTNMNTLGFHLLQSGATFLLVSFSWIFFRAESMKQTKHLLRHLFLNFHFPTVIQHLYSFNLEREYMNLMFILIVFVLIVEWLQTKGSVREKIDRQPLPVRWGIYLIGILAVILLGNYGLNTSGMFLYTQF